MNYSNTYILYPYNRTLELSLAESTSILSDELLAAAAPDSKVTVADIFRHTRGNYEQRRYNSSIYEGMSAAIEASLTETLRQESENIWANRQNNLGNVLAAMAQQKHDENLYAKAIACFNHALEVLTQDAHPLEWAQTQYNLGTATQALGRLGGEVKFFKQSVDAYTNALMVWTRKDTPEDWAFAMHQLGNTLHAYGKALKGNRNLQKSVVAYKNALAELNADDHAMELAATHNNRGAVLHNLGEAEENADRLQEAVRSYEKALKVCLEQQLPFHLAVLVRVNKATARGIMATLSKDATLAEEVADEYELILECFPHVLQPLCSKYCEQQLQQAQEMMKAFGGNG